MISEQLQQKIDNNKCLSSEETEEVLLDIGTIVKVVCYENPEWSNYLVLPFSDSEEVRNDTVFQLCGEDKEEYEKTKSHIELMDKEKFENLKEWEG